MKEGQGSANNFEAIFKDFVMLVSPIIGNFLINVLKEGGSLSMFLDHFCMFCHHGIIFLTI